MTITVYIPQYRFMIKSLIDMTNAERAYMARRLPRTYDVMCKRLAWQRAHGLAPVSQDDQRRQRLTAINRSRHRVAKACRLTRLEDRLRRLPAATGYYENRCRILTDLLCAETGYSWSSFTSTGRKQELAEARQVGMFLMLKHTHLNLPQVGALFGGRDHTTVLHARNKVMADPHQFSHIIDPIEKKLGVQ